MWLHIYTLEKCSRGKKWNPYHGYWKFFVLFCPFLSFPFQFPVTSVMSLSQFPLLLPHCLATLCSLETFPHFSSFLSPCLWPGQQSHYKTVSVPKMHLKDRGSRRQEAYQSRCNEGSTGVSFVWKCCYLSAKLLKYTNHVGRRNLQISTPLGYFRNCSVHCLCICLIKEKGMITWHTVNLFERWPQY